MTRADSISALLRSLDDARAHGKSLPGVVDLWLGNLGRMSAMSNWDYSKSNCASDAEEMAKLQADNARLRALISEKQWWWRDSSDVARCMWCLRSYEMRHAADCPAFTPEGSVR